MAKEQIRHSKFDKLKKRTNKPLAVVRFTSTPVKEKAPPSTKVVNETIDRAAEVLGSRDEAYRWLGTPIRGLDFATPIYILRTKGGVDRVKDVLGQMEHGTW